MPRRAWHLARRELPTYEVEPMRVLVDGRCLSHAGVDGVKRYTSELLEQGARLNLPFDVIRPRSQDRWGQQLWEHLKLPRLARGYDLLRKQPDCAS